MLQWYIHALADYICNHNYTKNISVSFLGIIFVVMSLRNINSLDASLKEKRVITRATCGRVPKQVGPQAPHCLQSLRNKSCMSRRFFQGETCDLQGQPGARSHVTIFLINFKM
jgi:hypothetical protein